MRTRLLACLAGGLLGAIVGSPISGSLGLSPTAALIGCSAVGAGIGFFASILFHVFASSPDDRNAGS